MCYGLPVIAFDSDGPREIIGLNNDYGLLIKNGDVQEFLDAINLLISNLEKRNYYAKKSIERKNEYELQNIIPQWQKLMN